MSLKHRHNVGLLLAGPSAPQLQFRDAAIHIGSDADGYMHIEADIGVNLAINTVDKIAITDTGVNISPTTASTTTTTGALTVAGGVGVAGDLNAAAGTFTSVNIGAVNTVASKTAAGTAGDIAYDASYIYMCIATNTWKRVAIGDGSW